MKKTLKLSTLALTLCLSAQAYSADINNNVTIGTLIGQTQISDTDYKEINYGLFVTNDTVINDNQHVLIDVSAYQANKGKFEEDFEGKITRMNGKVSYKYDFAVADNLQISPKVGVGFEKIQLKFDGEEKKETLNRIYAEIGAQVAYDMGNTWGLSSTVSYEKDLKKSDDWEKGDGYSVDFLVKKELENRSVIAFGPQFKTYKNDDAKLRDIGVKLSYNFQ